MPDTDIETGRSPADAGSGCQPSASAADASSQSGIPNAGDWVIIRHWGLDYRQIDKVTPKQFRLGMGSRRYPTQIGREDRRIVASFAGSQEDAAALRDAIAGVDGEFNRRRSAAEQERSERVKAATEARDSAVEKLLRRRLA